MSKSRLISSIFVLSIMVFGLVGIIIPQADAVTPTTSIVAHDILDNPFGSRISTWYSANHYWVFFTDNSNNLDYETSTTGASWSSPTIITTISSSCVYVYYNTYLRNNVFYYIITCSDINTIYYRWGTLNSDGSITWAQPTDQNIVTTTYVSPLDPSIFIDSLNDVWIATSVSNSTTGYANNCDVFYLPSSHSGWTETAVGGFTGAININYCSINEFVNGYIFLVTEGGGATLSSYISILSSGVWGTLQPLNGYLIGGLASVNGDTMNVPVSRTSDNGGFNAHYIYGSGWGTTTPIGVGNYGGYSNGTQGISQLGAPPIGAGALKIATSFDNGIVWDNMTNWFTTTTLAGNFNTTPFSVVISGKAWIYGTYENACGGSPFGCDINFESIPLNPLTPITTTATTATTTTGSIDDCAHGDILICIVNQLVLFLSKLVPPLLIMGLILFVARAIPALSHGTGLFIMFALGMIVDTLVGFFGTNGWFITVPILLLALYMTITGRETLPSKGVSAR